MTDAAVERDGQACSRRGGSWSEHLSFLVRDMARGRVRSLVALVAAFFVGALGIAAILLSQSSHTVLERSANRLGADVIVVSQESTEALDETLLMDAPSDARLPRNDLQAVAAVPGVAKVTPQLFFKSLAGAPCCEGESMQIVVYDPGSDFAVTPWLQSEGLDSLETGEVIGGAGIFALNDRSEIRLYGTTLTLMGNLERTGTGLDTTMYMTWDTAKVLADVSKERAAVPLDLPDDQVSSVLVKIADGASAKDVAEAIRTTVPGVWAVGQSEAFANLREQGRTLGAAVVAFAAVVAVLAIVLVVVVATFSVRERRREIGVLRALGATRWRVVGSLTSSSAVLALAGAILGTLVTVGLVHLFGASLSTATGLPLILPDTGVTAPYLVAVIVGVAVIVTAASALPILRLSAVDPAEQMRERA